VWNEFPGSIRVLLDNQYVFADFWKAQNGSLPEEEYKQNFAPANRAAHASLGKRDTVTVLSIVLSRIYTLRNQLVHGGATWGSSVNRAAWNEVGAHSGGVAISAYCREEETGIRNPIRPAAG